MIVFIWCSIVAFMFTACTALPQFFQSADDILTDEAVVVEVDKAAMRDNTNVKINVDVSNQDKPPK